MGRTRPSKPPGLGDGAGCGLTSKGPAAVFDRRDDRPGHGLPQEGRPELARTILLFHIISVKTSKHPRMVGSTLGVYIFGLIFVSARTNKRHHHHDTVSVACL